MFEEIITEVRAFTSNFSPTLLPRINALKDCAIDPNDPMSISNYALKVCSDITSLFDEVGTVSNSPALDSFTESLEAILAYVNGSRWNIFKRIDVDFHIATAKDHYTLVNEMLPVISELIKTLCSYEERLIMYVVAGKMFLKNAPNDRFANRIHLLIGILQQVTIHIGYLNLRITTIQSVLDNSFKLLYHILPSSKMNEHLRNHIKTNSKNVQIIDALDDCLVTLKGEPA